MILSVEPTPDRRIGGIETALVGWASALTSIGLTVRRTSSPNEADLRAADVVHFHGLWERSHPALARRARALHKPVVVSPHGMLEPWAFAHKRWKKLPYFHLIERPHLHAAEVVLATSRTEADALRQRLPRARLRTLSLGIDEAAAPDPSARRSLGYADDERVVLYLSRLHPKKGLHLLLDAWPKVARAFPHPLRLVIVGEGEASYVNPLRARSLPSVEWIGPRWGEAKWPYLQAADLFCLPTFSENFGLVVLESLLVGTPVLTTPETPWGSAPPNLPITLTPPRALDLTEALIHRLRRPPPDHSTRLATHQAVTKHFGWSQLISHYADLYLSLHQAPQSSA